MKAWELEAMAFAQDLAERNSEARKEEEASGAPSGEAIKEALAFAEKDRAGKFKGHFKEAWSALPKAVKDALDYLAYNGFIN